ncbi:MAG: thiamine pyrophosphate-dependent enzyme [Kibdelosporangium sp.]
MTAIDIGLLGFAGARTTDQPAPVHWCEGCGDYAELDTVQALLPGLGPAAGKIVLFSGIECSGQSPTYRLTGGVHVIHGRAPSIATGLAMGRPDLSVWIAIRDGHTLATGGNHLINTLHSNVDIKVLLYDNKPDPLAMNCDMTFLGRVGYSDRPGLAEVLTAAARHRGSALVQIRPAGQRVSPTGILRQVDRPTHTDRARAGDSASGVPELDALGRGSGE